MNIQIKQTWKSRLKKFGVLAGASGGGPGYIPFASGTFGSLLGCALALMTDGIGFWFQLVLSIAMVAGASWLSGEAQKFLKKKDASTIVIDEVAGMYIALLGVPKSPYWIFVGFLLFRFFDIYKVPPADWVDKRIKTGWGVVLDDVVAGLYSNLILHLMLRARI